MLKSRRILLHLSCIARKSWPQRAWAWHWQHLLREFGLGEFADRKSRPNDCRLESY